MTLQTLHTLPQSRLTAELVEILPACGEGAIPPAETVVSLSSERPRISSALTSVRSASGSCLQDSGIPQPAFLSCWPCLVSAQRCGVEGVMFSCREAGCEVSPK